MAIFDPGTCRVDAVSLAGSAIGAPRARRKYTVRCDEDLRQVRLMSQDASASDLESESVEATLCAGCTHNYEQRVTSVGCSACGLRLAAGIDVVLGIEAMCPSCAVQHVELVAHGAVDAAVERAEAPLRARVAELEAAAPQAVPTRLAPLSRFDGRLPATDRNGRELGEGARGYYLPGVGGNKGNWVPLNPQLAEVVTSGLTVMARIPDADAGASVKDYFYFMAQVRGMALQESLGAPALELYVEGTGLRYAMPLDELGVYGPPLEAFREISRSGLISNVLAVADGANVHDQGKTIDPVRLREMTMRAALARSSDALAPGRGTPPKMRRPQATPSRDRTREPTSLGRRLGAQAAAFLDRPGVRHDADSRGAMAVGAHADADDLEQHAAVFPAAAALDQSPRAIEQRGAEHDRRESARDAERARSHLGTAVGEGTFQTPSARLDQASDEGEQRTSATISTPARAAA